MSDRLANVLYCATSLVAAIILVLALFRIESDYFVAMIVAALVIWFIGRVTHYGLSGH